MATSKPSKGLKTPDENRIVEQFKTDRTPFSTLAEEHGVAPSVIVSILEARVPDLVQAYWAGMAGGAAANIPVAAPLVETASFETITPQAAQSYLIHNSHNRTLAESVIRRYAADIAAGRWKRNGASIVFGRSGRLLDGQHRLQAIARGTVSVESLVVRNADDAVFDTIDSGKSRSLTDIVGLMGVQNAKVASPAARLAYAYASGGSIAKPPPRIAVTEFVGLNEGIKYAVEAVSVPGLQFPKPALAAVLFLASPMSLHPQANAFIEGLATGVGLEKGDARIALREWEVLERRRGRGQIINTTAFTAAARAWNAFAAGKSVQRVLAMKGATRATLPIVGYRPENVIGATLIGTVGRHDLRAEGGGAFAPRDPSVVEVEPTEPAVMEDIAPEMRDAIQAYVETEDTLPSLAKRFNVSETVLKRLLRDAQLTRRATNGTGRIGLDHNEVIALYATGDYSYATLANKFAVHQSAIYYILRHKAPHLMKGLGHTKKAA